MISWPNAEERLLISHRFERDHGIPGAVGIVDGTPVFFSQRPGVDGEVFWSRKCRYGINLQLVCDDKKKIRFYVVISYYILLFLFSYCTYKFQALHYYVFSF